MCPDGLQILAEVHQSDSADSFSGPSELSRDSIGSGRVETGTQAYLSRWWALLSIAAEKSGLLTLCGDFAAMLFRADTEPLGATWWGLPPPSRVGEGARLWEGGGSL